MKRINRKIIIIASSLLLILSFQNCSKTGIQVSDELSKVPAVVIQGEPEEPEPEVILPPAQQTEKVSQSFASSSKYKTMDLVMVVDNSASMTNNVTQTKNNLSTFFGSLNQETDVNFKLITKADAISYGTSLKLSDYSMLGSQINFMVHSYNPMLIAAASTCPIVPAMGDAFCNQVKSNSRYNNIYGSLNSFFRPGALKVFVFVSDDDSSAPGRSSFQYDAPGGGFVVESKVGVENEDFMSANSFKARMVSAFGSASSFKSFGFLALNNGAACRARVSNAYIDLNAQSGGASFDICETNWQANFDQLTDRVLDFADTTYVVNDAKFVSVDSVDLGGAMLVKDKDYKVSGNVVTLESALVQALGTYNIKINYTRKM